MTFSSSIVDFEIRPATSADIPLILDFIKELAEYEKLTHEVVADEENLHNALFGERPVAETVIGYYQKQPVSFALFFHNFSTFLGQAGIYLEDLYIKPDFRGRGFGRMHLIHLAALAKERNCRRLEWSVLDWNTPAIEFYKNLGAVAMDEWTVYRVADTALDKLAGF